MPIEFIQVFVRPNIETPWFHDTWSADHMEYIQTTYKDTGKYTGNREISSDELLLTVTHTFIDEASHIEFISDTYLATMVANRDAHNKSNSIYQLVEVKN